MRRKKSMDLLGETSPDMNSLLDIIFILLIFVMLSMQIGKFRLMDLDFPETEKQGASPEKRDSLKIYILDSGEVRVEDPNGDSSVNLDLGSWESAIEGNWKERKIVLATEKKVPFENFVLVLDRLQKIQPLSLELGLKEK